MSKHVTNPFKECFDPVPETNPAEALKHYAEGQKAQLEITKIRAGLRPAEVQTASPDQIVLEVAMQSSSTSKLEYLIDPWLPSRQVVGFYGRGQTAKSSFLATLAARISDHCSTLWISTEVRWSRSFGQSPGRNKLRPVPGIWF